MTDLGILLARHGYDAVARDRTSRGGADAYVSRLLGRRTVVLGDPDGARAFYDESLARRAGAVPSPLAWLLFGRGAVHGMDGTEHRDRKRLILDVLDPDRLDSLVDEVRGALAARAGGWIGGEVDLRRELVSVYGAATLHWAGLDVTRREADSSVGGSDGSSTRAASPGRHTSAAGDARRWAERWARRQIRDARDGRTSPRRQRPADDRRHRPDEGRVRRRSSCSTEMTDYDQTPVHLRLRRRAGSTGGTRRWRAA